MFFFIIMLLLLIGAGCGLAGYAIGYGTAKQKGVELVQGMQAEHDKEMLDAHDRIEFLEGLNT